MRTWKIAIPEDRVTAFRERIPDGFKVINAAKGIIELLVDEQDTDGVTKLEKMIGALSDRSKTVTEKLKAQKGIAEIRRVERLSDLHLYSSYYFPSHSRLENTTVRLFATPRGQVGSGFDRPLEVLETTMNESGRLDGNTAATVHGIEVHADGSGIAEFARHAVLSMDFLCQRLPLGPVALMKQTPGFYVWSSTFNVPVLIAPHTNFAVLLEFGRSAPPVPAGALVVRVVLNGTQRTVVS